MAGNLPQPWHRLGDLQALHQEAGLSDFRKHFDQFLDQFGHLSNSTVDFTSIPWRESPDLILRMVCEFTPRETKQVSKISLQDLKCRRLSFCYLCFIYQRARQLRLYREMYSSQYTYTLLLLRDHFHTLGERLTVGGLLSSWQDIFFLYLEELRNWVNGDADGNDLAALVAERKYEMARGPELIRLTWHDPEVLKPEITALYHKPLQVKNWDKALWELTLTSRAPALADRLDEFDVPILVMTGDDDRIVPTADSLWLAGELPIAELVVISNAGHVPHEEQPDVFMHAVTSFLK